MMKEQFTEAMEYALQSHRERCSCVQPKDIVKFIFQGFLGMGHLLGEPDQVEKRIANTLQHMIFLIRPVSFFSQQFHRCEGFPLII